MPVRKGTFGIQGADSGVEDGYVTQDGTVYLWRHELPAYAYVVGSVESDGLVYEHERYNTKGKWFVGRVELTQTKTQYETYYRILNAENRWVGTINLDGEICSVGGHYGKVGQVEPVNLLAGAAGRLLVFHNY